MASTESMDRRVEAAHQDREPIDRSRGIGTHAREPEWILPLERSQPVVEQERELVAELTEDGFCSRVGIAIRIGEGARWMPKHIGKVFVGIADLAFDLVVVASRQARMRHRVVPDLDPGHFELHEISR